MLREHIVPSSISVCACVLLKTTVQHFGKSSCHLTQTQAAKNTQVIFGFKGNVT